MLFDVPWKDMVAYHYEQCSKNISIVRYYFFIESNQELKNCYKLVMHSVVNQHENYLKKEARDKGLDYDKLDFGWIAQLHSKIDLLNDNFTSR